jgi:RNA polymerase sigma-70 factor (ECF subfamily)
MKRVQDEEATAIEALKSGDISGLGALVRLHQLGALRLAYNLCCDRELAEDVVSEAFLAAHRHIDTYDGSRPFRSWFYRIVVNGVRSAMARNRRLHKVPDARDLLQGQADPGPGPEADVLQRELETAVLQWIDQLPAKQREATVLRYYLDLDERTMASILKVPVGTVKWRLFQARKRLYRQMSNGRNSYYCFAEEGQGS